MNPPTSLPHRTSAVASNQASQAALRRMAWVCVLLVLLVTTLSAYMRLDKTGLGCDGWPHCYGQAAAEQTATADAPTTSPAIAAARLAHRVTAVAVLVLVLAMLASCLSARPRLRAEGALVLALLAVTMFLAVLGVWTARSQLPAVTLGNLLGGFVMLALCLRLAAPRPLRASAGLRVWLWIAALLVLAQVALGGMISATHAALSCDSLAECWTAASTSSWQVLDPWRVPLIEGSAAVNPAGAPVQLLHRIGALLVLLCCLPLAWRLRRQDAAGARWLLACLLLQAALGPLMVALNLPMALVLLHNVLAATTLALLARWL